MSLNRNILQVEGTHEVSFILQVNNPNREETGVAIIRRSVNYFSPIFPFVISKENRDWRPEALKCKSLVF
jgi:hypothetical protein